MKRRISFSGIAIAFAILWCLFTVTNYQEYRHGGRWGPFKHDMFAYYAYLPAVFVYDWDLEFKFTAHIPENDPVVFLPKIAENGRVINKVAIGMSVMFTPAFLVGHAYAKLTEHRSDEKATGFSKPYRIMMHVSTLAYMLWALVLLRRVLRRYFSDIATGFTLIAVLLGTNVFFYTVHEHMMSHAYSFFLYSAFIYLSLKWHDNHRWQTMLWLAFVLGIIFLVRPTNIVIALAFLLFDVRRLQDIPARVRLLAQYPFQLGAAALTGMLVIFPQLLYWKKMAGSWFYFSYADNERFYWTEPALLQGLFGYCKGWFVYTPVMFIALIGFFFVWRYAKAWFWPLVFIFCINTWVVLAWWSWWYGGGFGLRAFAEAGAFMTIGLGAFMHWIFEPRGGAAKWRYALFLPVVLCVVLNLFQTMQYKKVYIIWNGMTKERYWAVFGRVRLTDEEIQAIDKMVEHPKR